MTSDAIRLAVAKAICAAHGDDWNREGRRNELLPIYGPLADAAIAAVALSHPRPEQVEDEAAVCSRCEGTGFAYSEMEERMEECPDCEAALARPAPKPAADVPAGWRLVPEEPTEKMLWADAGTSEPHKPAWNRAMWQAFLAAAPTPANAATEKEGGQFECASARFRPETPKPAGGRVEAAEARARTVLSREKKAPSNE